MPASVSGLFSPQQFTDDGSLASGYRLYTYLHGSTSFKSAYTDIAANVPHSYVSDGVGGQYIALNSRGELPAPMYIDDLTVYDIALKRPDGSAVWTRRADSINSSHAILSAALSAPSGASIIGYDPEGGAERTVQEKLRETPSVADSSSLYAAILGAQGAGKKLGVHSSITIRIPTDCATLQDAVDNVTPLNKQVQITLQIESGHLPASGIKVNYGDYGQFRITSVDALVTLHPSYTFVDSFIYAHNSIAPVLACMVDADRRCKYGYYLHFNSSGFVEESCGVKNCSSPGVEGAGLFLNGSCQVSAYKTIWTGSYRNIWAAHESTCFADWSVADGAIGDTGVYAARGSMVGISYGSAKNCVGNGLRVRRARLVAMAITASGNGTGGAGYGCLASEGSVANLSQGGGETVAGANLSGCFDGAIYADSSVVIAEDSNLSGPFNSINATNGATVIANRSNLSGGTRGVNATSGANVSVESSTMSGCSAEGIRALASTVSAYMASIASCQRGISAGQVSRVDAGGVTITGSSIHGILSQSGSVVRATSGSVKGSVSTDLRIESGGQIVATGCATTLLGTPSLPDCNVVAFNAIYQTGIVWA